MKPKFLPDILACSMLMGQYLISCDDNNDPSDGDTEAKILIETTIKNHNGVSSSSYIQLIPQFIPPIGRL